MTEGHYREIKREGLTNEVALLLKAAEEASKESRCIRKLVGAAGQSLKYPGTFYRGHNGIGCDGLLPCPHLGKCSGTEQKCLGLHAERNMLTKAHIKGDGITQLVVTMFPCCDCAKALVAHGLQELYFIEDYGTNKSMQYLLLAGVNLVRII